MKLGKRGALLLQEIFEKWGEFVVIREGLTFHGRTWSNVRRRNKFAGYLREAARKEGLDFELKLSVNQAIGYVVQTDLLSRVYLTMLL